ncbi:MAG TPA: hypothetical protein VNJ28_06855, partial [Candidatus Limnocylindrales bacterium]|nr:hypothetical protein [Candidatus Limnocylindrales bacterium]
MTARRDVDLGAHGLVQKAHDGVMVPVESALFELGSRDRSSLTRAETDRALVEAGRRLVVVADHTKWGVVGISTTARLDEADVLVTDSGL